MSNFFSSKARILGFIFSLISACTIIGCSVMLSFGDNMTIEINNKIKKSDIQPDNKLNNELNVNNLTNIKQTPSFNWKKSSSNDWFDLIDKNMLYAKSEGQNTKWRPITNESISKPFDSDKGYKFTFNDGNFKLLFGRQRDEAFAFNLSALKPSDVLEGVSVNDNEFIDIQWNISKNSSPDAPYKSSLVKDENNNSWLVIEQPLDKYMLLWVKENISLSIVDSRLGNQSYELMGLFQIFIQTDLSYKLINNNLLNVPNILKTSETSMNDLQPLDSKKKIGYEFSSIEPNELLLNISGYKDKYFEIDFNKLDAKDILEDANLAESKNSTYKLDWQLGSSLPPNCNAQINNNILRFSCDQNYQAPSTLLLQITDLSLPTNAQDKNPIVINFNQIAYGVSIPSSKSVYENDTLTISDSEINIVGVSDTDLANAKYQWQSLNQINNQWEPIKGQTNKILTINNISIPEWNNKQVRLVIDINSKTLTSNACLINVTQSPQFNIDVSITPPNECFDGDSLTITPTIKTSSDIDQALFKYQWVDATNNNEHIPGQTNKDFNLNPIDMTWDGRQVKLKVTYNQKTYESNIVTISVKPKISISLENPINVIEGETLKIVPKVEISSKIDSSLLSYQWFDVTDTSNPTPITNEDATNQTLLKNQIDLSWDKKQVKLIATYKGIEYPSNNIATIIVNPKENITPPPEANPPSPEPIPPSPEPIPPVNPPVEPQPTPPSLPSNVIQIGVGSSNYGFTYDKNGNIISNQHWQGSYLSSVQKARNLISEIDNKLSNPNLAPNEIILLQTQKEICNKMILASNLVISGSVLVGLFGIIFIASIIVMIEFSKFWM